MANEGKCDQDIYQNGEHVGIVVGGDANVIEAFVKCAVEKSGQPMDWHYVGGRANVLTTGDVGKAKKALRDYQLQVSI